MAKTPTFPRIIEDALCIKMAKLKEWGYLKPYSKTIGEYIWSSNGNEIGQIGFYLSLNDHPFIQLEYNYRGNPVNTVIKLAVHKSNLGRGLIYYFICPKTGNHCRK